MAEAVPGDVIVADLHDELGFSGTHWLLRSVVQRLGPPGAWPVKPGGRELVELARQRRPLGFGNRRGEADMIEHALSS